MYGVPSHKAARALRRTQTLPQSSLTPPRRVPLGILLWLLPLPLLLLNRLRKRQRRTARPMPNLRRQLRN